MSWGCREDEDSREFDDANGALRGVRRFHVWSTDEDLSQPLYVIDRFGQDGTLTNHTARLPAYRDYFLNDGRIIAVSPRITNLDSADQLWLVEWAYLPFTFGTVNKQPNEVGYVSVSISSRFGFKPAWRQPNAYPAINGVNGSLTGPLEAVSGLPVDVAGEPMSVPSSTADINVGVTVSEFPPLATLDAAKGKRNSVSILGAAPGRLAFIDYTFSDISRGRYRLGYHFASDGDFHLVQVPARDTMGRVIPIAAGIPFPGIGSLSSHAAVVLWRQPFPGTVDFYSLSPWFAGQI